MKVGIVSPQLGQQATRENVLQTAKIAENEVLILSGLVKGSCGH
ncbi:MAG: hypothetical protein WBE34_16745 [Candidatus Nitrosopolaris sp.]